MKTLSQKEMDEWNAQRERLEIELVALAERLVDHMGSCNVQGNFEIEMSGGRVMRINISASPRLRSH